MSVSAQAVHFTQADQVHQLVSASEADPDLGFMARTMALCSLPRSNPGNRKEYKRVNGPFTLYMVAGGGNKLPYGNLPRLILAWVSTEAVRTQSRELDLGKSLSEFMRHRSRKSGLDLRFFGPWKDLSYSTGGVCRNAMGCSLAVGEGSVDEYARVAVARDVGSGSKPDH